MKKFVKLLSVSVFTLLALAGFSACAFFAPPDGGDSGGDDFCEHRVSKYEYDYDETYHWYRCYCEHKDTLRTNMVKHTIDSAGKCYCGYAIECRAVFTGYGVDGIPVQTVRAGEFFTEPPEPERDGYAFGGWRYLYSDNDWAAWNFKEQPAFKKELELYPVWEKVYKITYDATGGALPQGTESVQVYKEGEEIADPVTPVREKYEFKGWSSDPDTFVAYDFENNKTALKDVTVYAFWERLYYVDYHLMDESDTVIRSNANDGTLIYLQGIWMTGAKRDGYDLLGWTTVEGGSEAGTESGDTEIYVHGDVDLYAVWIPAHAITYDGAGGLVQSRNGYDFKETGYSYLVRQGNKPFEPQAKREGYTFVNWTADTSTNAPFDFGKELEADTTLYAVWTYYTVTLRVADGQERLGYLQTAYDGAKVTVGTQVYTGLKERSVLGYEFDGWYGDDGQLVSDKAAYNFKMTANDVSLTAKWRVKAELSGFEFTSDSKELCITSIIDKSLTEIIVPDYATEIAECAFYGCNSVQSMTIPFTAKKEDGGKSFPLERAFYDKPFDVTTMEFGTYYPKTLTAIVFTGKKLSINAFSHLRTLSRITFTDNPTEIPERAFYLCKSLTSIDLPQTVTSIGDYAFCDCGLTAIDLPAQLETLGDNAFTNCDIKDVVIHENIREIGSDCFTAVKLTSVTFEKQFTWTLTYNGESKTFVSTVNINHLNAYKKNQSYLWRRK